MNSAEDIAQQQTDMDNAWSDYQPAVDDAYYHSQENGVQPDGSDQETQDSKKLDIPEPDKHENPFKQRFLDQLTARGHSQEDALEEWQNLVNSYDSRGIAIVSSQLGMDARLNLDEAKRMADSDKRMRDTAEAGGWALAVAGGLQAAGFGLRYALSQAAKAEAAGESTLAALWKRVADYLPGGGAAVESEAAAPSASGAAGTRSWDLGPWPRGEAIEAQLGRTYRVTIQLLTNSKMESLQVLKAWILAQNVSRSR